MRVLMLGWEFPPYISGGLGTACFGITSGLTSLGQEIIFVLPRLPGKPAAAPIELISADDLPGAGSFSEPIVLAEEIRQAAGDLAGIEINSFASPLGPYLTEDTYGEFLGLVAGDWFSPSPQAASEETLLLTGQYGQNLLAEVMRYASLVGEFAGQRSFDLIHAHDWMTIPAGIAARNRSGKPLILHIHSLESDRSGDHPNSSVYDIELYGLKEADHIIAVSNYTKNRIIRFYRIPEAKITVVHNAVTHQEALRTYRIRKPGLRKIVLFIGRITLQKGPDYFVEAAAKVLAILPEVTFVMAGAGDMMPRLIERVADLGIGRNFHFTGFLKGEDVERIFALSDLYVMPSVSEPFGISPLEAISYDVPVIISHQSGVSELIRHALKVDFWDTDALADRIISVLKHPPLGEELTGAAREELNKIHWTGSAEKIIKVYEKLALET